MNNKKLFLPLVALFSCSIASAWNWPWSSTPVEKWLINHVDHYMGEPESYHKINNLQHCIIDFEEEKKELALISPALSSKAFYSVPQARALGLISNQEFNRTPNILVRMVGAIIPKFGIGMPDSKGVLFEHTDKQTGRKELRLLHQKYWHLKNDAQYGKIADVERVKTETRKDYLQILNRTVAQLIKDGRISQQSVNTIMTRLIAQPLDGVQPGLDNITHIELSTFASLKQEIAKTFRNPLQHKLPIVLCLAGIAGVVRLGGYLWKNADVRHKPDATV